MTKRRSIESYLTPVETSCLQLSRKKLADARKLVQQEQAYIRKLKAAGYNRRLREENQS